jgi:hypothetical protein
VGSEAVMAVPSPDMLAVKMLSQSITLQPASSAGRRWPKAGGGGRAKIVSRTVPTICNDDVHKRTRTCSVVPSSALRAPPPRRRGGLEGVKLKALS